MKLVRHSIAIFAFLFSMLAFAGVDLNSASKAEIEGLPGVGAKMADAIVAARPFKSIDDLKNVKGIGDAKFEKLKGLVSVGGASTAAPGAPAAAPAASAAQSAKKGSILGSIFKKKDSAGASPSGSAAAPMVAGEKISLNHASAADLERLPGIGPKKAQDIVSARPFQSLEDVMKVKGIKEGIFKKIQPYLSL